jgi:GxxExxY protein
MPPRRDEQRYPHFELTQKIIAAGMKVHTALGPGYAEKIYENAMMRELASMGLRAERQVRYVVTYSGFPVGEHVLDIVVERKVYVELKCQKATGLEVAQVVSGLKASGLDVGLLLNFNTLHLRDGIERVLNPGILGVCGPGPRQEPAASTAGRDPKPPPG